MGVRDILKSHGITMLKFAEDFGMARNTVSSYIQLYDDGKIIAKEKYRIIFDRLFATHMDDANFYAIYNSMKRLYIKDKVNGSFDLSPNQSDYINNLIENLVVNMASDVIDHHIRYFLITILNSYKNDSIFGDLAMYFNILNNGSKDDYDKLPEEKKIVMLAYYKLFIMQKNGLLKFEKDIENLFFARLNEIKIIKEHADK